MNQIESNNNLFFKYQPVNEFFFENLSRNQLFFNNPRSFNDPFDCRVFFYWEDTIEAAYYAFKGEIKSEERLQKFINRHSKGEKFIYDPIGDGSELSDDNLSPEEYAHLYQKFLPLVYCFSKKELDTLMWSHYADYHKGVCLCFESTLTKDGKNEPEYNLTLDGSKETLCPVRYYEEVPNLVNWFDPNKQVKVNEILLRKLSIWEYEEEHRIILPRSKFGSETIKKFKKEELKSITFGLRMKSKDAKEIYDIVESEYLRKGIHVDFYKAMEIIEDGKPTYSLRKESLKRYEMINYIESLKNREDFIEAIKNE